ncbi:MAG: response regulator [Rhodanobacteraceae bacterium]|nr:response regulator [Rhodanobacteraceae bacterium]
MGTRRRIDAIGWRRFQRLSLMGATLLLVTAWLAFSLHRATQQHFEQSTRALAGVDAARDYLQAALDAEVGARSYVLTGEVESLAPFSTAAERLARPRAELAGRVGDAPALAPRMAAMDHALDDALSEMQTAVALYREQGADVVVDFLRGGFGRELMARARSENAAISMALTARGRSELAAMREAARRRDWAAALALLLGLACGVSAFLVIREHTLALQDEHRLRLRAEQAMRESSEKSVFLANMSHEIRTPMNAIFGFTELLGDLVQGERERQCVRAIRSSGETLLALIDDILDLARVESGRIELRPEPVDLRELLRATATLFAQQVASRRLRLTTQLEGHPSRLLLDPLRVRQVLFNLVGNAIKYTDVGAIEVRATVTEAADGMRVEIAVRDSGIGIALTDQARIFEAFTQVAASDRERRGGAGLGLSIVQRLMQAMGGRVELESAPGRGSTFTAVWERVQPAPAASAAPAVAAPRLQDLPPLRLLAIDDHALNLELLQGLFADTPHRLEVASDARAGLAQLRAGRHDGVLLDLRMPGMDGREALQAIRADPALAATRVIAITASSLLDEERALRQAFDGYVRKPATREAIAAALAQAFGAPAAPPAAASAPSLAGLDATARQRAQSDLAEIAARCARARETLSTQALGELESLIAQTPGWPAARFADAAARLREARLRFELAAMEAALEEIDARCAQLSALLVSAGEAA